MRHRSLGEQVGASRKNRNMLGGGITKISVSGLLVDACGGGGGISREGLADFHFFENSSYHEIFRFHFGRLLSRTLWVIFRCQKI